MGGGVLGVFFMLNYDFILVMVFLMKVIWLEKFLIKFMVVYIVEIVNCLFLWRGVVDFFIEGLNF